MDFIAHFRESDKSVHLLREHLNSVAEMCENYGTKIGMGKLAKLTGILHDMGKYSDEFQNYIRQKINTESLEETDVKVDHGKIGAMYIFDNFHCTCNMVEKITAELISMIICSHHGGLNDYITADLRIPLLDRFNREKNGTYEQCVNNFFGEVCTPEHINTLFKEACDELRNTVQMIKSKKLTLFFSLHILTKLIYSILIDADRYDTYLFMENKEETAVTSSALWELYAERLEKEIDNFRSKPVKTEMERKINEERMKIADICLKSSKYDNGIYTLTVPTGGGKTLSSLRFALNHAKERNMERIIYVLPYTTIIEQNAAVVREVLQCGENLLEHHCNVIHTENEKYKLLTQRWDCPIVFTTIVQFLNTIYESGTSSIRRLHQLNNSILIFDEIQTIPIKCISLFNEAINYLSGMCHCTVLLSSATQPNLNETTRPINKAKNPEIVKNTDEFYKIFKRMNVVPKIIGGGYTTGMLKEFILELKKEARSILVVLNTKQAAEDVFKALSEFNTNTDKCIYLLSTNLCPAHRKAVIKKVKSKLKSKQDIICISTQLIEAGVDISFEVVIRSLAGLDSIAQASGRGNRHGEAEIRNTYIANMQNENISKHLKEIAFGQKHTQVLLYEYAKNPEKFNYDLLSPAAIYEYYKLYYKDEEIYSNMDYPVKSLNEYLYGMLTSNNNKKLAYKDTKGEDYPFELTYMFRTASDNFSVIDDNTRSLLVPYKEGRQIISDLLGSRSLAEIKQKLKESQQYSVNVFEYQFEKLISEDAIAKSPIDGVNILKEGYYDDELGIVMEKKMEFMNI